MEHYMEGVIRYSRTYIQRPILGQLKHGRYGQVVVIQKHFR